MLLPHYSLMRDITCKPFIHFALLFPFPLFFHSVLIRLSCSRILIFSFRICFILVQCRQLHQVQMHQETSSVEMGVLRHAQFHRLVCLFHLRHQRLSIHGLWIRETQQRITQMENFGTMTFQI